jgi:hypothetical protein
MIYDFDRKMGSLKLTFFRKHNGLCTAMLRSVLTPYLYEYDYGTVERMFTENLVLQTLDSVPGLRTLRLSTRENQMVESMLTHLTHLHVFSYKYYCTNEVIKQLGLHCHDLKKITF